MSKKGNNPLIPSLYRLLKMGYRRKDIEDNSNKIYDMFLNNLYPVPKPEKSFHYIKHQSPNIPRVFNGFIIS